MTRAGYFFIGLMAGFLLWMPEAAFGQECVEEVLCVITEERNNDIFFYVDNQLDEDLIVIFHVETENMTAGISFPYLGTFAGKEQSLAFTLRPKNRRAPWRYSYAFRWRKAVNRLGCQEGLFCIVVEEHDPYIEVYVENERPFDLAVELDVQVDNAVAEASMPHRDTYPANRRTRAFRFKLLNRGDAVQYKFAYQWLYGRLDARHDDAFAYALPYAPGKSFAVVQDFNGAFSHAGKFAIDWDMPERTPVHAARGGIVVEVEVGYTEGGLDDRLKTRANNILIQHNDGTLGNYVHLAPNGAFVTVGQEVAQGQVIGVSGNTGFSSGPHLHFEVYRITKDFRQETIPIRFRVEGRGEVELKRGRAYTASLR